MKYTKFQVVFVNSGRKFESSYFTVILGILTAIGWISLIIWNRLIRERLPRDLTLTVGKLSGLVFYIQLGLFVYFFALFIAACYKLYKEIRKIEKPLRVSIFILKFLDKHDKIIDILQFLYNYVLHSPLFLLRFTLFNISNDLRIKLTGLLKRFFLPVEFALFSNKRPNFIKKKIIVWVILAVIPKVLAFAVLSYEVIINKYICYFYYIAIILLIPVIFAAIRRIMHDVAHLHLICLAEAGYFKITDSTELEEDVHSFDVDSDLPVEEFEPYIYDYRDWIMLYVTARRFYFIEEEYKLYINIVIFFLLSLSFGGMLLIRLGIY